MGPILSRTLISNSVDGVYRCNRGMKMSFRHKVQPLDARYRPFFRLLDISFILEPS